MDFAIFNAKNLRAMFNIVRLSFNFIFVITFQILVYLLIWQKQGIIVIFSANKTLINELNFTYEKKNYSSNYQFKKLAIFSFVYYFSHTQNLVAFKFFVWFTFFSKETEKGFLFTIPDSFYHCFYIMVLDRWFWFCYYFKKYPSHKYCSLFTVR